ncbi:MAG: UvrD-helicase domain-containing protein [Deltaproteobacteria bacterium]|nr:UvrD-helicase domain-containing protein [Deltaproteobacteria bacterium]
MSPAPHRVLRASAGTGKTYALVDAYVGAIAEGRQPSEIVAITFTRKAAAELCARIRARLLATGTPRATVAGLAEAPIGNFHGLALRWLRMARDAEAWPISTEVMGEGGDDAILFAESCLEAWFGGDDDTAAAVAAVAPFLALDVSLPDALWHALAQAREDGAFRVGEALFGVDDWRALQARQHGVLVALRERLKAALPMLSKTVAPRVAAALARPPPAVDEPPERWATCWHEATRGLDRRGKLGELISGADLELLKEGVKEPAADELCARLAPHLATLVRSAWRQYQGNKAGLAVADFGDLVERFVSLMQRDAGLHRAVREQVKVVLVDEAQDANRLQREMVRLLAGTLGPGRDATEPARLFVVGDKKQAIYGFRGGDPASFAAFSEDVKAAGGVEEVLEVSRRSSPELVASINHLGEHLFGADYDRLVADVDVSRGRVSIRRPGMTWLDVEQGTGGNIAQVAREAGAVAAWIGAQIDAGAPAGEFAILLAVTTRAKLFASALAAAGIPAVFGGGATLYSRPEIIDVVAFLSWLADPGDRLSAAVALRSPIVGLSESALLALLGHSERGGDRLSRLRHGEAGDLESGVVGDQLALRRLGTALPELVDAGRSLGPAAVLEALDALLDLRSVLLGLDAGEQRLANFDRLCDLAQAAEAERRMSLWSFARQQAARISRGHQEPVAAVPAALRHAVVVSSVHQAKGLQFPTVLLCDLRHAPQRDHGAVLYARDIGLAFRPVASGTAVTSSRCRSVQQALRQAAEAEQRRLLYVAVTRAEREVILFGVPPGTPGKSAGIASLLEPWRESASAAAVLGAAAAPAARPPHASADRATVTEADRAWARAAYAGAIAAPCLGPTTLTMPVTALESYLACPRRGFFRQELGLYEAIHPARAAGNDATALGAPALSPRARGRLAHEVLGALHRCGADVAAFVAAELRGRGYDPADTGLTELQRDLVAFLSGDFGRTLCAVPAADRRVELPFSLALATDAVRLVVHGQIDLLVADRQGLLIVDYKHGSQDSERLRGYQAQVDMYALAVAQLCGDVGELRTALVFLRGGGAPLLRRASQRERETTRAEILATAAVVARARTSGGRWPGLARESCVELGCGFIARCFPREGIAVHAEVVS